MDNDMQSEVISNWGKKDSIKQTLLVGIHGMPEFKHDEKIYYLGEFKENVLRVLSKQQVSEAGIYPEILQALDDERGKKMIIDGSIDILFTEKYKKLASRVNKPYTVRNNPEFKGTTGLLVVSDDAVDRLEITVKERSLRLKELGIDSVLINAVGKKICKECWEKIIEADPTESANYQELTFLDRISGERCPGH